MSEPALLWSVVIPLHNKQDFIASTLRSVLEQASDELELIVVDDGSTDDSASRVLALGDARIRLHRQANAGVSAARNQGIRLARGRWVVFLDADDLLHPQALAAYGRMLASHPEARVLAGKEWRVPDAEMAGLRFDPLPAQLPLREITNLPAVFLKQGLPFSSSSIAIRRDVLLGMQPWFPEGESMGEDLDLWLRLGESGPIVCTSAVLAAYRTALAGSLMGSYRGMALLPVWQRLRERASRADMPPALVRDSLRLAAEMEVSLARRLAKSGRRAEAWRHLLAARHAIAGHRWWVTALALASVMQAAVDRLR